MFLAVLSVSWAPTSSKQVSKPEATLSVAQDDARLAKLPVPLREKGRLILAEPDEDKRADLVESLAEGDAIGALDFLLTLLDTDPSADVRENIVDELEEVDDPRVDPALARRVLDDADLDIALASLDILRARAASPLMRLLEQRLDTERKSGRTTPSAGLPGNSSAGRQSYEADFSRRSSDSAAALFDQGGRPAGTCPRVRGLRRRW